MVSADSQIHPAVAEIIPTVIEIAHEKLRDQLNRIVIHGSAVTGNFRPGESDVDITILIQDDAKIDYHITSSMTEDITDITGPWSKIDVAVHKRRNIEWYRDFELCYEGRVCHGLVVFDCNIPWHGMIADRDTAKLNVTQKFLNQSWRWIDQASEYDKRSSWSCSRGACRALHAVLVAHEFDQSPKVIRWNLKGLLDAAIRYEPDLAKMNIHRLDHDIAHFDFSDMELIDPDYRDEDVRRKNRIRIKAAKLCVMRCERVLGLKADRPMEMD